MSSDVVEVQSGVIESFDGERLEVKGGAYLSPEEFLRTTARLDDLERRRQVDASNVVPALVLGAALLGLAAGYWLARPDDEEA